MHGKFYFECCTQHRGVMSKGSGIPTRLLDLQVDLRCAPYANWKLNLIRFCLSGILPNLPARYGYKALWCFVLYALWCLGTTQAAEITSLRTYVTEVAAELLVKLIG